MECPHCKQELDIGDVPYLWLEHYGSSCVATTNCCGHAVRVSVLRHHRIEPYVGGKTEDDWARPFKPTKQPVSQTPAGTRATRH